MGETTPKATAVVAFTKDAMDDADGFIETFLESMDVAMVYRAPAGKRRSRAHAAGYRQALEDIRCGRLVLGKDKRYHAVTSL